MPCGEAFLAAAEIELAFLPVAVSELDLPVALSDLDPANAAAVDDGTSTGLAAAASAVRRHPIELNLPRVLEVWLPSLALVGGTFPVRVRGPFASTLRSLSLDVLRCLAWPAWTFLNVLASSSRRHYRYKYPNSVFGFLPSVARVAYGSPPPPCGMWGWDTNSIRKSLN